MTIEKRPVYRLIGIGLFMMVLAVVTEMLSLRVMQETSIPQLAGLGVMLACGAYLTMRGARNAKKNDSVEIPK